MAPRGTCCLGKPVHQDVALYSTRHFAMALAWAHLLPCQMQMDHSAVSVSESAAMHGGAAECQAGGSALHLLAATSADGPRGQVE